MLNDENDIFKSSDLSLVAAISLFYPIHKIDKKNPRKLIFIFKKDKDFDQVVEKYWTGRLQVSPLALLQNLKALKSRIHQ
jgi:hypothetical protein